MRDFERASATAVALARELLHVDRSAARRRVAELQKAFPSLRVRLISDGNPEDGEEHEIIVTAPGEGVLSVSCSADGQAPWVLRGAQRWREQDLLRIDGCTLSIGEALTSLDSLWEDTAVLSRLLDLCCIYRLLAEHPIELDERELQEAVDLFRASRGLHASADTLRWLAERGLNQLDLERLASSSAIIRKLRKTLVEARIEAHFAAHAREYDEVLFVEVPGPATDEGLALIEAIVDFVRGQQNAKTPLIRSLRRKDCNPQLAQLFDDLAVGSTRQWQGEDATPRLIRLLERRTAVLDAEMRERVAEELFRAELRAFRRAAKVDWNWGEIAQIDSLIRKVR